MPKPLTSEAFAAFGDVIDTNTAKNTFSMNYGTATRFYDLANVDVNKGEGETCISLVKSNAVALPHQVKTMEYHPLGSQIFHPLGNYVFLILVAPPSEKLDIEKLECFITNGKQGVNYHRNVWHHYLIPLKNDSEFIVIDRKGEGDNCIESDVESGVVINQG